MLLDMGIEYILFVTTTTTGSVLECFGISHFISWSYDVYWISCCFR